MAIVLSPTLNGDIGSRLPYRGPNHSVGKGRGEAALVAVVMAAVHLSLWPSPQQKGGRVSAALAL